TSITNASWLNSYQLATAVGAPEEEQAGTATDPFASNDGFLKWRGIHRLDWNWNGWDVVGTLRYTDGFRDRKPNGLEHWVKQTWVVDGQASYDFTVVAPVGNQPVAGYSKDARDRERGKDGKQLESSGAQTPSYGLPIWQRVLTGTPTTLGCDNIFGIAPPKAYGFGGNSTGY